MERNERDHPRTSPNNGSDQESGANDHSIWQGMEDHENHETQSRGTRRMGTLRPRRPAHDDHPPQNRQILSPYARPFRPQHSISNNPYDEYRFQSELNSLASQMQRLPLHERAQMNQNRLGTYNSSRPTLSHRPMSLRRLPFDLNQCHQLLPGRFFVTDRLYIEIQIIIAIFEQRGASNPIQIILDGIRLSRHELPAELDNLSPQHWQILNERLRVPLAGPSHQFAHRGSADGRSNSSSRRSRSSRRRQVPRLTAGRVATSRNYRAPFLSRNYHPGQLEPRFSDNQSPAQQYHNLDATYSYSRPVLPLQVSPRPPGERFQRVLRDARFHALAQLFAEMVDLVEALEARGVPNAIPILYNAVRQFRREVAADPTLGLR